MPDEDLTRVEYKSIIAAARREGWLRSLMRAHFRPCTQDDAIVLLAWLRRAYALPRFTLRFGSHRGRAGHNRRTNAYRISLPAPPGTRWGNLRVGIVLHEAAHLIHHARVKRFGHDAEFRSVFRTLLVSEWRAVVKDVSQTEIYSRHRGPYSLLLARRAAKGTATDRVKGPLSDEEAHETARRLVTDAAGDVMQIHVFSDTEGQYTGAFYERGGRYESWEVLRARELEALDSEPADDRRGLEPAADDEHVAAATEAALLPEPGEPVREAVAADEQRMPTEPAAEAPVVRDLPPPRKPKPIAADTKKPTRGAKLQLNPAKTDEPWPTGASLLVYEAMKDGARLSVKELVERLAAPFAEAGVEFPASLISRLKQRGFLKEVTGE